MTSVSQELAAAVRRVNVAYSQLDNPESVDIFTSRWVQLERNIELALAAGDDRQAVNAIKAWQDHAIQQFEGAAS